MKLQVTFRSRGHTYVFSFRRESALEAVTRIAILACRLRISLRAMVSAVREVKSTCALYDDLMRPATEDELIAFFVDNQIDHWSDK